MREVGDLKQLAVQQRSQSKPSPSLVGLYNEHFYRNYVESFNNNVIFFLYKTTLCILPGIFHTTR